VTGATSGGKYPGLVPIPTYRDAPSTPLSDLQGVDLFGRESIVRIGGSEGWTLLFFLTSGCDGCVALWGAVGDPQANGFGPVRVVVVTRDAPREDGDALRRLAPPGVPVVMSSAGWDAYRVHGPPFFVLIHGAASIVVTEGVAWGVEQIAQHVASARRGEAGPEVPRLEPA
jgi:hypothetical protein